MLLEPLLNLYYKRPTEVKQLHVTYMYRERERRINVNLWTRTSIDHTHISTNAGRLARHPEGTGSTLRPRPVDGYIALQNLTTAFPRVPCKARLKRNVYYYMLQGRLARRPREKCT